MFGSIMNFFKRFGKNEKENSKTTAKERLHLVLAQDRANISADFLEMMKQEIIEVIKKYIDIDEEAIDVRMTNKPGEDGIVGAPALYANIPIVTIKNEARKLEGTIENNKEEKQDISENKDVSNEASDQKTEDAEIKKETETVSKQNEIDNEKKIEEGQEANSKVKENNETDVKEEKEANKTTEENKKGQNQKSANSNSEKTKKASSQIKTKKQQQDKKKKKK